MPEALLKVQDLAIELQDGSLLLEGAQLELHAGERLTIVCESGAGKSILAQAIMGTLPAALRARGQITIAGHATDGERSKTQALWGKAITMLPQEPWTALSPLMRMHAQVSEAAHYAQGLSWGEAQSNAMQRMAQLGIGHAAQQWLHQISGGMAQRVGVAASGMTGARIVLADEPTKGLDPSARDSVAQLLLELQSAGQALLTITHDLALARLLGGKVLVMQAGRVVESGPAEDVFARPQHVYTQALLAAQPANWASLVKPLESDRQSLVIQAHQLSKSYGDRHLFQNIDLSLQRGETLSVSGASGCGKTTLGNILLGLVKADAGHVEKALLPRHKFQKLYQDPPAAFVPQRKLRDALQDLSALHRLNMPRSEPLMQELGLKSELLDRLPSEVSGGELQRIALLRLMLLEPAFIFADEPTSRLDVITQHETMKLLMKTAASHQCAVLLVSHDAELAKACSHRHLAL
ncbi:MAG: ABC transporter ATP-binding protein [Brachymonas sp.]